MHIPLIPPVVCTSLSALLFIVLFIKSHILFLHILLFCTFLYSTAHFTFYFFFYLYICSCVVLLLYNFVYSLHCPLSGPDLTYISLLIIPYIIYYVTNKETLNLGVSYSVWSTCIVARHFSLFLNSLTTVHRNFLNNAVCDVTDTATQPLVKNNQRKANFNLKLQRVQC